MTSFDERLKQALDRVEQRKVAEPEGAGFLAILEKFAEELNAREGLFVHASVERGPHARMWRLVTSPKYRRRPRTGMLTFWLEGAQIRVLGTGDDEVTFSREQDLEEYLVNFLEKSSFPETLAEYEQICLEDVDGFLRVGDLLDVPTILDVIVRVPAEIQKSLALASPGSNLELEVEPASLPTTSEYDPNQKYRYLSSAGFGLRLKEHEQTPEGWVKLRGEVMAEGERQ